MRKSSKKALYGILTALSLSCGLMMMIICVSVLSGTYGRAWKPAFDTTKTLQGQLVPYTEKV